ncbi:hypothetical protein SNEBB_005662 [Seison nebaliae]|nr:hypothetical protein SNEBB_005662 [Seison nebaliae]
MIIPVKFSRYDSEEKAICFEMNVEVVERIPLTDFKKLLMRHLKESYDPSMELCFLQKLNNIECMGPLSKVEGNDECFVPVHNSQITCVGISNKLNNSNDQTTNYSIDRQQLSPIREKNDLLETDTSAIIPEPKCYEQFRRGLSIYNRLTITSQHSGKSGYEVTKSKLRQNNEIDLRAINSPIPFSSTDDSFNNHFQMNKNRKKPSINYQMKDNKLPISSIGQLSNLNSLNRKPSQIDNRCHVEMNNDEYRHFNSSNNSNEHQKRFSQYSEKRFQMPTPIQQQMFMEDDTSSICTLAFNKDDMKANLLKNQVRYEQNNKLPYQNKPSSKEKKYERRKNRELRRCPQTTGNETSASEFETTTFFESEKESDGDDDDSNNNSRNFHHQYDDDDDCCTTATSNNHYDDSRFDDSSEIASFVRNYNNNNKDNGRRRRYVKKRNNGNENDIFNSTSSTQSSVGTSLSLDVITVVLDIEQNGFLGISLVGQTHKANSGCIYVASVMDDGAVAKSGKIAQGDMILQVNNTSFEHLSSREAVEALKEAVSQKGKIKLVVAKCSATWDNTSLFSTSKDNFLTNKKSTNDGKKRLTQKDLKQVLDRNVHPIDPNEWLKNSENFFSGDDKQQQQQQQHHRNNHQQQRSDQRSFTSCSSFSPFTSRTLISSKSSSETSSLSSVASSSSLSSAFSPYLNRRNNLSRQSSSTSELLLVPGIGVPQSQIPQQYQQPIKRQDYEPNGNHQYGGINDQFYHNFNNPQQYHHMAQNQQMIYDGKQSIPALSSNINKDMKNNDPNMMMLMMMMLNLSIYTDMENVANILMRENNGLDVKDRQWLKVKIADAFLGADLVSWLYQNVNGFADRRDAKRYASKLLKFGYIRHAIKKERFSEQCYYIFNEKRLETVREIERNEQKNSINIPVQTNRMNQYQTTSSSSSMNDRFIQKDKQILSQQMQRLSCINEKETSSITTNMAPLSTVTQSTAATLALSENGGSVKPSDNYHSLDRFHQQNHNNNNGEDMNQTITEMSVAISGRRNNKKRISNNFDQKFSEKERFLLTNQKLQHQIQQQQQQQQQQSKRSYYMNKLEKQKWDDHMNSQSNDSFRMAMSNLI